jgi:peptidoglycan/xylan/chitin deacetylase (PgdA/CDA1 family)
LEVAPINSIIKNKFIEITKLSGIKNIIKRRLKYHLAILLYHTIEPENLDWHLTYLKKEYNIISLQHLLDQENSQQYSLPPYPMIITFDDGWRSNHSLIPILKKHNVKATVFLTAGLINTKRKIWNTVIRDEHPDMNEKLKSISNKEKNRILQENYNYNISDEFPDRTILTSKEIKEMLPWFEFQSHGMNHSVLTKCDDQELNYELTESKEIIQNITGQTVYALAYPYNLASKREIKAAIDAGYKIGRIGKGKLNNQSQDRMQLYSIPVNKETKLTELKTIISKAKIRTLINGKS